MEESTEKKWEDVQVPGMKMDTKLVKRELRCVQGVCRDWENAIEEVQKSEGRKELEFDFMRRELTFCAAKLEAMVASLV